MRFQVGAVAFDCPLFLKLFCYCVWLSHCFYPIGSVDDIKPAEYADNLFFFKEGELILQRKPKDVLTGLGTWLLATPGHL